MKKNLSFNKKLSIIYMILFLVYTIGNIVSILMGNSNMPIIGFIIARSAFFIYFLVLLISHNKNIDFMNKILSLFILIVIISRIDHTFSILKSMLYTPVTGNFIINFLNIIIYVYIWSAINYRGIKKKRWVYLFLMVLCIIVSTGVAISYAWNDGLVRIITSILESIIPLLLDLIMIKYAYDFNTGLIKE